MSLSSEETGARARSWSSGAVAVATGLAVIAATLTVQPPVASAAAPTRVAPPHEVSPPTPRQSARPPGDATPTTAHGSLGSDPTPVTHPTRPAGHFDPATSTEDVGARTARSKTFVNRDGTRTSKVFSQAINVRDAQGRWVPIDTALARGSDGRLHTGASPTGLDLAPSGDDPALARLTVDAGHAVAFGLPAPGRARPRPAARPRPSLGWSRVSTSSCRPGPRA